MDSLESVMISAWICAQGDADVPLSEVEGDDDSPDYSYRLVCVIMHQGVSPNCGG
jgi:hypothetical protein